MVEQLGMTLRSFDGLRVNLAHHEWFDGLAMNLVEQFTF